MIRPVRPIRLLASILLLGLLTIGQKAFAQPKPPTSASGGYEIWVTHQSKDAVQIIDGLTLKVVAEIPMDDDGQPATSKPHTITFSPNGRYAYVANVGAKAGTNNIAVINTANRKGVATLPAGPGAHMVMPSPNGTRAFVANAGGDTITEIKTDTVKGEFKIGRTIVLPTTDGHGKSHPICLTFSADSKRLYVTNAGPAGNPATSGFLAVLEVETGKELHRISNLGREVCGQVRSRDGRHIYFTIGGTVGEYAVLDTKTNQFIKQGPAGGRDPHGIALTPGENQVWITNRLSNQFTVLSATTLDHFKTYLNIGDKPDLLAFSPDGLRIFVTLRGKPVTPFPDNLSGSEPGMAVIETDTGKILTKLSLDGDPHGIAVRTR